MSLNWIKNSSGVWVADTPLGKAVIAYNAFDGWTSDLYVGQIHVGHCPSDNEEEGKRKIEEYVKEHS